MNTEQMQTAPRAHTHRRWWSPLALCLALGVAGTGLLAPAAVADDERWSYRDEPWLYDRHDADRREYRRGDTWRDFGRVVKVEPIYPEYKYKHKHKHKDRYRDDYYCEVPRRAERKEERRDERTRVIIGGVAGATIGNVIGREQGNAAVGTVVGAVIGAAGAKALSRDDRDERYDDHDWQRCEPHRHLKYDRKPEAYRVTYQYRGRTYVTRTQEYPGRFIRIDSGWRG